MTIEERITNSEEFKKRMNECRKGLESYDGIVKMEQDEIEDYLHENAHWILSEMILDECNSVLGA